MPLWEWAVAITVEADGVPGSDTVYISTAVVLQKRMFDLTGVNMKQTLCARQKGRYVIMACENDRSTETRLNPLCNINVWDSRHAVTQCNLDRLFTLIRLEQQ